MLLVAAETVSRTCIATILYLISNVSAADLVIVCVGMGHHALLLRARRSHTSRQVPRRSLHLPQRLLRDHRRREHALHYQSKCSSPADVVFV